MTLNAIETLLRQPAAQATAWALLQFVWQGTAVGILTALALVALRRSASDVRYVVASIGLALMLTLPVVSGVQKFQALRAEAGSSRITVAADDSQPRVVSARVHEPIASAGGPTSAADVKADASSSRVLDRVRAFRFEPLLPTLMLAWLIGVALLSLRRLTGWLWIQRLRTHGVSPAHENFRSMAARLSRRLHISRAVALLESTLVEVPTVIGFLKPVILLPASAIGALAPHQLEAILAHELAHIRRHDYLVNLMQTLVETVLFYHPAVWWLSYRIRVERENCCDDLAVSLCGDPVAYASALADLEALRSGPAPDHHIAMAATGGSLLLRVRRLLGAPSSHAGRGPAWLAGSVALLLVGGIALGADGRREKPVVVSQPAPAQLAESTLERAANMLRTAAPSIAIPSTARAVASPGPALASIRTVGLPQMPPPAVPAAPVAQPAPPPPVPSPGSFDVVPPAPPAVPARPAMPAPPAPSPFLAPPAVPARPAPSQVPPPPAPPAPSAFPAFPAFPSFEDFLPVPPAPVTPAPPAMPAPPAPMAVPAAPEAPALPPPAPSLVPPAVPAPPAPPSPVSQSVEHSIHDSTGNWIWSNNGEKLQVSYSGTFEFTDDDADVKSVSSGGYIKISDGAWLGRHSVEIRERNGHLEHHYYVNASERPYGPEGRQWLQEHLPKFVRNSGIGAPGRVARFLKSGGVPAVTAEISRIDGSYVKGIYFRELFKQATLTPEQYRQVMAQASREMHSSDYELAQLLIAIADQLPNDETSRAAYFTAASGISSDYELRRVYSTMLKRGPVTPQILAGILEHSKTIESDYELSQLLQQILSQQSLDDRNRAAFFTAVSTIDSDYERHRVLSAVFSRDRASDPALVETALNAASSMSSDYEAGTFLKEVLKANGIEGAARAPFFKVVGHLDSSYERGQVLQAVVRRPETSTETLRAVLNATSGMSGYDLSQVLQLIAKTHSITGDLRETYVRAAEKLSGYEQGQVMTALVKSERRK